MKWKKWSTIQIVNENVLGGYLAAYILFYEYFFLNDRTNSVRLVLARSNVTFTIISQDEACKQLLRTEGWRINKQFRTWFHSICF